MRFIVGFFLILWSAWVGAAALSVEARLGQSRQLLVVTAPRWESVDGELRFYQRVTVQAPWEKMAGPFPVVVGKAGFGWGVEFAKNQWPGPRKQEGDGRSPVGVFSVGPLFGFETHPRERFQLPYLALTETQVCVDDPKSQYYNQLLDAGQIRNRDWVSAEVMRQIPLYYWGFVIQYNMDPPVPGGGSCVFLHLWRGPGQGTAGCVALEEKNMLALLSRLDARKKPVLALLPEAAYPWVKKRWGLPALFFKSDGLPTGG